MVHWGWLIMALGAGVVIGIFVIAVAEVAREEAEEERRRGHR